MRALTVTDNQGQEFIRVSKIKARRAFNDGLYVTLCPAKLYPFGEWNPSVTRAGGSDFSDFDLLSDSFKYSNCTHETGRYISYYLLVY